MSSVAASIATWEFNKAFAKNADKYFSDIIDKKQLLYLDDSSESYYDCVNRAVKKGALFDARCFNIPKEEVANLLYWRQLDAVRNSVEMVGHVHFTTKELHKKSCNEVKELLLQKGIDWEKDFSLAEQRGVCCYKRSTEGRDKWFVDKEIPIFSTDFSYVEKHVLI